MSGYLEHFEPPRLTPRRSIARIDEIPDQPVLTKRRGSKRSQIAVRWWNPLSYAIGKFAIWSILILLPSYAILSSFLGSSVMSEHEYLDSISFFSKPVNLRMAQAKLSSLFQMKKSQHWVLAKEDAIYEEMKDQMFSHLEKYTETLDFVSEKEPNEKDTIWGYISKDKDRKSYQENLLSALGKFQRFMEMTPTTFPNTTSIPTRFRRLESRNRLIKWHDHPINPFQLGVAEGPLQTLHREVRQVTSHLLIAAYSLEKWEKCLLNLFKRKYSLSKLQYSDTLFLELLTKIFEVYKENSDLGKDFLPKTFNWVYNKNDYLQTLETQKDAAFNQLDILDQSINILSKSVSKTLRDYVPRTRGKETLTIPTLGRKIYKDIEWINLFLFQKQLQSLSTLVQEAKKRKFVLLSHWEKQVEFLQNMPHNNVFTMKEIEMDLDLAKKVIETPLNGD